MREDRQEEKWTPKNRVLAGFVSSVKKKKRLAVSNMDIMKKDKEIFWYSLYKLVFLVHVVNIANYED